MDFSQRYVKMCEKAVEMQSLWNPTNADFVKGNFVGYIKEWQITQGIGQASIRPLGSESESGKYAWYEKSELAWLPRQDQLQKMIDASWFGENTRGQTHALVISFNDFWKDTEYIKDKSRYFYETFEQCWLALIMKSNYQKYWNGKEWTTEKGS